jgi:cyclopropane fatty-acyl-phospholipid synthase-like methyltransferase
MSENPWDEIFKEQGAFFGEPHEDMPTIVELLKRKGSRTVLDLGSGSGRHVVYLAKCGFSVYGLDSSPEGIEITRNWLKREGLTADLRLHSMLEPLPYDDDFFDAVISIQVIHHAKIAEIKRIVQEIARVLKRDGLNFVTVPKQKSQAETFQEIEPNTFIPLDGLEKGLPHHYFTPEELRKLFKDFTVTDIHLDSVEHYCLLATKL